MKKTTKKATGKPPVKKSGKCLYALAALMLVSTPALAGYDYTTKNIPDDFTEPSQGDLNGDYYILGFDTDTGDSVLVPGSFVGSSVQFYNDAYTSVEVGAGIVAIAGRTGQVLKVSDIALLSNGAAAGATSIDVECTGGTNLLSAPVGMLVDDVTVGKYTSAAAGKAQADYWTSANLVGCPSGEGIQVVKTGGTITGSTDFKIEIDYTWN